MVVRLIQSELIHWAKRVAKDGPKFHAAFGDVPYGLGFMGMEWDTHISPATYQYWVSSWAEALIPLMYPGALCAFFGGRETHHRLAVGLEDAGFEIEDEMMWVFGEGWPKAGLLGNAIARKNGDLKDAQQWGGHSSTLKPAWEPLIICRAPRQDMNCSHLAQKYGSGYFWIEGGRIPVAPGGLDVDVVVANPPFGSDNKLGVETSIPNSRRGRWPADFALCHSLECEQEGNVWKCVPDCPVAILDRQSGILQSGMWAVRRQKPSPKSVYGLDSRQPGEINTEYGDKGGASRFFYRGKASSSERHRGCEGLYWCKSTTSPTGFSPINRDAWIRLEKEKRFQGNIHTSVKPVEVARYIGKLLLPPPLTTKRQILVPFAGSGSEVIGAGLAGWDCVNGVEIYQDYCQIAVTRLRTWLDDQDISLEVGQ